MKLFDCRGRTCPGPVIQAKLALEEVTPGSSFILEVDSEAARDNVSRFANSRGAPVEVVSLPGPAWKLTITAPWGEKTGYGGVNLHPGKRPPVIFIASDTLGRGDDKLGGILLEGFVNTLPQQESVPDKILLMNGGVRLAVEGSHCLPALNRLLERGCEILACGTCLDFFGLKEKLAVGRVSDMFEIQGSLLKASSVIRP